MGGLDWFVGDLPSNRRIVTALLDLLLQSGDVAGHARVCRRLGLGPEGLPREGPWLTEQAVKDAFLAAHASPRLARRVGQALVRLEGIGPFLCHSGIATVEKAYRRSHHWMAREAQSSRFAEPRLDGEVARIRFEGRRVVSAKPATQVDPTLFCEMRIGMLEALPMVFGLLPATVRHTKCGHRGAAACEFEVRWSRHRRTGFFVGGAIGLFVTFASLGWWIGTGGGGGVWPAAIAAVGGIGTLLLALAGRSFDLSSQLEAVAGARRGQLALLDQVDQSLAEKLDELAKLGTPGPRGPALDESPSIAAREVADVPESGEGLVPVRRERAEVPTSASRTRERLDLGPMLEHVCAAVASERPDASAVSVDVGELPRAVEGDRLQLEFMLEQLLRNALDANGGGEGVRLGLGRGPTGAELVVEDRGPGIDQEVLDEAFDPFFEAEPAGVRGGLGLPVCYRIVAEHGGQLRVESRPGEGTRVFVHLPEAPPVD